MFKKSRKAKGQEDALGALTGAESGPITKSHRGLTRRKKKQEADETPAFDLSSALPDTDDFRTSLLMPNLSKRFSMLREQDDPNSLIGKASDDSVLFPKRTSRMNHFNNNNPLVDIAEVESIHSSIRPPFADERNGASPDGYASDDGGSIMNRSRPGEVNNLFGGRQKLYKIPAGSAKNVTVEGGMTRGKHTYESDVSLSAFQQIRLREKDQREVDESTDRSSFPNTESEEQDSTRSPLTPFSQNRGTQSSTNSGPSNRRTSTAATSVVSDSPLPHYGSNSAISKVREQDANSSAESIGFASSPGVRKIREDGSRSPYHFGQPRGAAGLKDNTAARQSPVSPPGTFRGMSPPPSAMNQPLDFGLKDVGKPQPVPSRFQAASPTEQLDFDQDDMLVSNVRPNDRGKAPITGIFNKPSRHYDDAVFQQRQAQMHEGRNSPMSASSRAASRASPDPYRSRQPSFASTNSPLPPDDGCAPQLPPIPDYTQPPASTQRSSAASNGRRSTSRPRTKSSASNKEAAVQARVQSLIRKQNAELAALEENHLGPSRPHTHDFSEPASPEKKEQQNYLEISDHSDDEVSGAHRPSSMAAPNVPPPPPPPSTDIHPAFRDGFSDFDFGVETRKPSYPRYSNNSTLSKTQPFTDRSRQSEHESMLSMDDDSTQPPTTGLGLSGLVRAHLRHDSDRSSMLPPSPGMPADVSRASLSSTTKTVTESVKSDPFEFDNDRPSVRPAAPEEQPPQTFATLMSQRAQQMLANAAAIRDAQANNNTPKIGLSGTEDASSANGDNLRGDLLGHRRSESTETQREQQRFDEELAERRRRIQEGLKSVHERSRSRSPEVDRGRGNQGHGFSLPRFPGRSNMGDRAEPPSQNKAMKMLGISSASREQSSPRVPIDHYPLDDRSRNMSSRQGHRPPMTQDYDQSNGRAGPGSGRPSAKNAPNPPRSTTPSSRPSGRSRSSSAAADRLISKNKHVPEYDHSMMPGAFSLSPFLTESSQNEYVQRAESPAGTRSYERSASVASGHLDRPTNFNSKSLAAPSLPGDFTPRPSPRPSPALSESFFAPPMATPMSPSSSAIPSPNPTNGRTTPGSGRTTPSRDRKRSVNKNMISEPTFVSSTSTVPLVHLPRDGGPPVELMSAPPLPAMNPRRRGTAGEQHLGQHPAMRSNVSPLPVVPASPVGTEFQINQSQATSQPQSRIRNKLRKSSSEGGSIAARARNQALVAEMAREKDRSPNVAVFPNKSATSLHMIPRDGGMF